MSLHLCLGRGLLHPYRCRVHCPSIRPTLRAMLCRRLESYMPRGKSGVGCFPDWLVNNLVFSALFRRIRANGVLHASLHSWSVISFPSIGLASNHGKGRVIDLRSSESRYYLALRCSISRTGLFLQLIYAFAHRRWHLSHRSLEGPDTSRRSRSQVLLLRFLWVHRSHAESHVFPDNLYTLSQEPLDLLPEFT